MSKGWFSEHKRHSNAKKHGVAGSPYSSDKKKSIIRGKSLKLNKISESRFSRPILGRKSDTKFTDLYNTNEGRRMFNGFKNASEGKMMEWSVAHPLEERGLIKRSYKTRKYADTGKEFQSFEGFELTEKGKEYFDVWKNQLRIEESNLKEAKRSQYTSINHDYGTSLLDEKNRKRSDELLPSNIRNKGPYSSGDLSKMRAFRAFKYRQKHYNKNRDIGRDAKRIRKLSDPPWIGDLKGKKV